jgi:hypothetical protein
VLVIDMPFHPVVGVATLTVEVSSGTNTVVLDLRIPDRVDGPYSVVTVPTINVEVHVPVKLVLVTSPIVSVVVTSVINIDVRVRTELTAVITSVVVPWPGVEVAVVDFAAVVGMILLVPVTTDSVLPATDVVVLVMTTIVPEAGSLDASDVCPDTAVVTTTPLVVPYTIDEDETAAVVLLITVLDTGDSTVLVVPSTIIVVVAGCVVLARMVLVVPSTITVVVAYCGNELAVFVADEVVVTAVEIVPVASVVTTTPLVVPYTFDEDETAAVVLVITVLDTGDSTVVVVPSTIYVVVAYCVEAIEVLEGEVLVPASVVVPAASMVDTTLAVVPYTNDDVT